MKPYIIIILIICLILIYLYGFINALPLNMWIFFLCYDNNNGDHFFNKNKMRG